MARQRSSGGCLRYMHPSYLLKRPRQLAFTVILFVFLTLAFWDRQTIIRDYQEEITKLNELNEKLSHQLQDFSKLLNVEGQDSVHMQGEHFSDNDAIARERRDKVKAAMIHAWSSYEKYAWGMDELLPQSRRGSNDFGGLGATIVDSLDTLYIMGLNDEFHKAKEWVAANMTFDKYYDASVFETTIRVLGGLLSAYDLSEDSMFLDKAKELADRLLPAWNTPTGIPYTTINLHSGHANNPGWTGGSSVLADLGTEQVELIGLSQRTGNPVYMEKAEKVINKLREVFPTDGLLPMYISPDTGKPTTSKVTFGAMGDSFFEYLLKVWILGNKTETVKHYREMWEQSMEGLLSLTKKSSPSNYLYIAERAHTLIDKMDELACFAPGMLALGSMDATAEKASVYLDTAKELVKTCYNFYARTPTKLAGENYIFREGQDMMVGTSWNILRPETVESLMYLWRTTGDNLYRDWGWNIFLAFEKQSRIASGYVGLRDVNSGLKDDKMQSFFLAETLKYLYLLFSSSDLIPLNEWVFNTEAHPIRVITRSRPGLEGMDQHNSKRRESQNPNINHVKDILERTRHNHLFGRREVKL
ncbi:hypothetical protein GOP47_0015420 [Adiantum capillus-veneris]|uniref:alpha-1,2-Mannosidase n=1 Tax=Adiantum capillus-veneris TaxID=13818 RepID=A0A9D4UKC4_ADICA|nr:hypothetical protein GOP47_0015420 [Adiantum capillus-veneris]